MTAGTDIRMGNAPVQIHNNLTNGRLPRFAAWGLLAISWVASGVVFMLLYMAGAMGEFSLVGTIFFGTLLYVAVITTASTIVEGSRQAKDRLMTALVSSAFVLALLPLISLLYTTVTSGIGDLNVGFFTQSMRNVVGEGGGALHAIMGTLLITGMATVISVPIGLFTAIYLVEYGRGRLARAITFLVDVMTGIPSIVAGLVAFAFFALIFNSAGIRFGFGGAVAPNVYGNKLIPDFLA